jgi:hypothetical protein
VMKGVRNGLRLTFPEGSPSSMVALAARCFALQPEDRPTFKTVVRHVN